MFEEGFEVGEGGKEEAGDGFVGFEGVVAHGEGLVVEGLVEGEWLLSHRVERFMILYSCQAYINAVVSLPVFNLFHEMKGTLSWWSIMSQQLAYQRTKSG